MLNALASPAMTPIQSSQSDLATMSAPPAFHHQHHIGSGPMDMFSPLTSPALGPTMAEGSNGGRQPYVQPTWSSSVPNVAASPTIRQPHHHYDNNPNSLELQHHLNMIQHQRQQAHGNPNKRPMSEDPGSSTRKRPSPLASVTSSPQTVFQQQAAQRKTRSQRSGAGGRAGHQASLSTSSDLQTFNNTPSPIDCDISMPPPAPPAPPLPPVKKHAVSSNLSSSASSRSASTSPNLEPVTPASMLSLGSRAREPTGLMPSSGGSGGRSKANVDGDVSMMEHLPSGPMTAQQQLLAEALTRAGVAAEGANSSGTASPVQETGKKGKGKAVAGAGSKSSKPSPVIKAGTTTPKNILPSGS